MEPASSAIGGQSHSAGSVPSLTYWCFAALIKAIGLQQVLPLHAFADELCLFSAGSDGARMKQQLTDSIQRAFVVLRVQEPAERLQEVLGAQLYAQLERGVQDTERVKAQLKMARSGKALDRRPAAAQALDTPSASGLPFSYPLESLLPDVQWPTDVDPSHREGYLPADQFQQMFGMEFSLFKALPPWKQLQLKKQHRMF